MSDEQTRLLQQILEIQKEQLAFAKSQREEFMAVQQTALAGQRKGLCMSRFVLVLLLVAVAVFVAATRWSLSAPDYSRSELSPEQRARVAAE
jgi:hypothetical protein